MQAKMHNVQAGRKAVNVRATSLEILDVAQELFQTRGYNGISYQDIAERVGIRKASIHHHFSGKAVLAAALVNRYRAEWRSTLAAIDRTESDPWAKIDRYLAPFRATARTGDRVCLCGVLGAEFPSLTRPVQREVEGFFEENHAWLARVLSEGRTSGTFAFAGSAASKAGAFFACLEGALVVARACGSLRSLDAVVKQLKAELRLPNAAKRVGPRARPALRFTRKT